MYCLYLRKSRKDTEAEARGEGETLSRHKAQLLALAKRQNLMIGEIYSEVVSGETLAARPEMQRLLRDVEAGAWDGVLVMEVERLARGNSIDQGIVAQTFKYSNTKIVTPSKTYDPLNEFDEEYFEFGLFMSRREYKTITRRLKAGMAASAREGNFTGNIAPYGYDRKKNANSKGWTLEPNENEATVVRQIFDWYVKGDGKRRLGVSLLARKLNDLHIPPRKGGVWVPASIQGMIDNPVYIGKIAYNRRPQVKRVVEGKVVSSRPWSDKYEVYDGKHPALISADVFEKAQVIKHRNKPAPLPKDWQMTNPLAGLLVCGVCGRKMVRRPYGGRQQPTVLCPVTACSNVSAPYTMVEQRILEALSKWLTGYNLNSCKQKKKSAQVELYDRSIHSLQAELQDLNQQRERIFEFYERGTYTDDVFLERSQQVARGIEEAEKSIADVEGQKDQAQREFSEQSQIAPRIAHLLEVYHSLPDAQTKNSMLKEVLEKIIYIKSHRAGPRHGDPGNFDIEIFVLIPHVIKR